MYKKVDDSCAKSQKSGMVFNLQNIQNIDLKIKHALMENVAIVINEEIGGAGDTKKIIQVDLREWVEPLIDLRVGITPPDFFMSYIQDYHHVLEKLFDKKSLAEIKTLLEVIGNNYSKIAMFSSFVKFLGSKLKIEQDKEFLQSLHEKLQSHLQGEYPPILILMNINGCLVHRTDKKIQFVKPDPDSDERKDKRWGRHVKVVHHKKHSVYFRDGHLEFLRSIMQHPRC